jgi:hypothetical protein
LVVCDFVELFTEEDVIQLNLEPIKKKEVRKIVSSLAKTRIKEAKIQVDKVYIQPEYAKELVRMMVKN